MNPQTSQGKIDIAVIKEQMAENQRDHSDIKTTIGEVKDNLKNTTTVMNSSFVTLNTKIDNLDGRFSSKWVEWFVKILIAGMVTSSIGIIIWMLERTK